MNARRIFAMGAMVLALSACSGDGPTLAQNEDQETMKPIDAAPTDTAGFIPPETVP